jgi:predicted Zn-dependent peptidase
MYELSTLENGLRILTVAVPHVQSVSVGFFLKVGSRYESHAMTGASHFIEHMLFKGTQSRPTALDIAEAIEGKGGVFNASTGMEMSLYWAKVAAPHMLEALDVLSDMLLHATFDPDDLEKERAVIGEEISYALETPDSLVQILASHLQWPDHPLGREIAGTRESVAGLSRESLVSFLSDHYLPGETVLGMAGKVEHNQAVEWARAHLGDWESGPSQFCAPAPPNGRGPCLHVEYKDTAQSYLSFSLAGVSRNDPRRFALRMLNVVLGEGMRSRLFQEIRERRGLAYSVDSYVSAYDDTGAVGVYAGVSADRVEDTIGAVLGELDRMRQEPVPVEELGAAKEFLKGRQALGLEQPFALASWYARQVLLGPEVLGLEEALERIEEVRPADIQHLAQALFQKERLNLAIVGPFTENGKRFRQAMRF